MVSTRAMKSRSIEESVNSKSASWPEPSAEEYSHNNKALAKDVVVFSTMIYILFYLSSTINEVTYDFPMSQLIGSLITSSVMILVMFLCRFKICFLVLLATTVDVTYHFFFEFFFIFFTHSIHFHSLFFLLGTFWNPHPTKNDLNKWISMSIIGHSAFFTLQSLFLQTAYTLCKAYALCTGNTPLLIVCYGCSLWVNTQGAALTFLFLKLNWYEKEWQKDREIVEKTHPGSGNVILFTHVMSLPVALFDAVFLCNSDLVATHGALYRTIVPVAFMYGFVYLVFAKGVQWSLDCYIYPFMKEIDSVLKGAAFVGIVGIAVCGIALLLDILMKYV